MSPRVEKIGKGIVLGFCGAFLLCCAGDFAAPIETAFTTISPLVIGWAPHLRTLIGQVRANWGTISLTAVYLVLLVGGAHLLLHWLTREIRRRNVDPKSSATAAITLETRGLIPSPGTPGEGRVSAFPRTLEEEPSPEPSPGIPGEGVSSRPDHHAPDAPQWRVGWTIRIFAIILLAFVPAMAVIGIVHQTIWLAHGPMYQPHYGAGRVKCAANMHNIGIALITYANNYGGHFPDDLQILAKKEEVGPAIFISPESDDMAAFDSDTYTVKNLLLPGHCSYIYLGKGLSQPIDPNRVIVCELPSNHHDRGIHVLYGDGRVEFLELPEADRLLLSHGFERIESHYPGPETRP